MDSIGIIIQARMGSTRLPGKILKTIGNKTLLQHIFFRLQFLQHPAHVVVATSDLPQDNVVEDYCHNAGISCFRGSELNVLERYYLCASHFNFSHIVRMTADNPFPDIEELDNLIHHYLKTKADFAHSFDALPIGVGLEIFSYRALSKSYKEGKESHHTEHVNEYMIENPEIFSTSFLQVPSIKNFPGYRLTVDTEEDYLRASYIVTHSPNEYVTTEEAISLCLEFV